jgi:hypothetical protein
MKLTRSISVARTVRWVLVLLAIAAIIVAVYLWMQQVKLEKAWRYKSSFPTFHKVGAGDLEEFYVPVNRKFDVVTNKGSVVGKWTRHPVGAGELVHPSQLTGTSPNRFRFDGSGEPLPEGMYGYHLSAPGVVLGKVRHNEYLSLSMVNRVGRELIVLFDKARILEKTEGGFFLGLTMDQIAAIEGLQEEMASGEKDEEEDGMFAGPLRLVWTITQNANPDLPPLAVFNMDLTEESLTLREGQ